MVEWVMDELNRSRDAPLFLAAGIYRPHLPWYAPQKYFDQFDEKTISLPPRKENDLTDIPEAGRNYVGSKSYRYFVEIGKYREAVEAYLASVAYADGLVGKLIDTLDGSPIAQNTVVILWSDHGWHLGEKEHWQKATLWERATRVPLIITVPNFEVGQKCNRPVSLVDLFPTLLDLCGIPSLDNMDGESLVPLLKNPGADWNRPALTTMKRGNHSLRSDRYRLIHYADGSEELYDHRTDPNEWTNLSQDPAYESVRKQLRKWLPKLEAPLARDHDAYFFNFEDYSWRHR